MPVLDLAGAYCPMGCGQTLRLTQGGVDSGMLRCVFPYCPDPGAAHNILADPEHLDIVEFTDDGFTVLHPLRERLGASLFDCPVNKRLELLDGPPVDERGKYRARMTEDGELELLPAS